MKKFVEIDVAQGAYLLASEHNCTCKHLEDPPPGIIANPIYRFEGEEADLVSLIRDYDPDGFYLGKLAVLCTNAEIVELYDVKEVTDDI